MHTYILVIIIVITTIIDKSKKILGMDLRTTTIGFIGCGKISSAVCRGYASLDRNNIGFPKKILLTRRSEEKSKGLKKDFEELVEVLDDANEIVVNFIIISNIIY